MRDNYVLRNREQPAQPADPGAYVWGAGHRQGLSPFEEQLTGILPQGNVPYSGGMAPQRQAPAGPAAPVMGGGTATPPAGPAAPGAAPDAPGKKKITPRARGSKGQKNRKAAPVIIKGKGKGKGKTVTKKGGKIVPSGKGKKAAPMLGTVKGKTSPLKTVPRSTKPGTPGAGPTAAAAAAAPAGKKSAGGGGGETTAMSPRQWWKGQSRGTQNTLIAGAGVIGGLALGKIFSDDDEDEGGGTTYHAPVYNRYYNY